MTNQLRSFYLKTLIGLFAILFLSCGPKVYHSGLYDAKTQTDLAQDVPPRPVARPGECWQIVELETPADSSLRVYNEFTGTSMPDVGVVEIEVVKVPGSEKWVKKKADRNCRSADPNDCLVWCLVKTDPVIESFYEVRDTVNIKEYRKKDVYVYDRALGSKYKDWIQVLCENEINNNLVVQTRTALANKGYQVPESCRDDITCVLPVLKAFQNDNGLAVGVLSYETFILLGIKE